MKNHLKDFPSVLEKIPSNYSITGKNQTLRLSKEGISLSFQVKLLTLQTGTHTHTRTHRPPRHQPGCWGPGEPQTGEGVGGRGRIPGPPGGVQLISPPFVPGESFKHPPEPLPLPPGSTRQLHLEVQIQPLSLFLLGSSCWLGRMEIIHFVVGAHSGRQERIDSFGRRHCYLLIRQRLSIN